MTMLIYWIVIFIAALLVALVSKFLISYASQKVIKGKISVRATSKGPSFVAGILPVLKALWRNELHLVGAQWSKEFGDFIEVNAGFFRMFMVNNAELAREISNNPKYKNVANDRNEDFSGKYIFNNNQDILTSMYTKDFIKRRKLFHSSLKFYGEGVNTFEKLMQDTLKHFTQKLYDSYKNCDVPLSTELTSYICKVVGLLLKGTDIEENDNQKIVNFVQNFNATFSFEVGFLMSWFPFLQHIPGRYKNVYKNALQSRAEFVDTFFKKVRDCNYKHGIVADLLKKQHEQKITQSPDVIADELIICIILDIAAAGYLTTSASVTSLFLHLIRRPDIQERIFSEINSVIGDSPPSFEHRRQMPFTEATILEESRMTSVAPLIGRCAKNDFEFHGHRVSKGSPIILNTWSFHHSEDHWETPWVFNPERFLDEQGALLPPEHPTRKKLLPFGTGPCSCPGESFARARIFMLLTYLLQHFRFLPPSDEKLPCATSGDYDKSTVMNPKIFHCRIEPRN